MTRGVSQWLWPLEIPSHTLHKDVERACHALALDDERTTFHPVLWDETGQAKTQFTKDERISQVWFTGVHANVGGGYPDDSLAQIPLYWIMQEATVCGLKFKPANPAAVAETKEAQDKDGRLYDSRSGFGGYYRYGPRRVSRLCNQVFSNTTGDAVHIAAPKYTTAFSSGSGTTRMFMRRLVSRMIMNLSSRCRGPTALTPNSESILFPTRRMPAWMSTKQSVMRKRAYKPSAAPFGRGSIGGRLFIF
jgi:hypothetical protein